MTRNPSWPKAISPSSSSSSAGPSGIGAEQNSVVRQMLSASGMSGLEVRCMEGG